MNGPMTTLGSAAGLTLLLVLLKWTGAIGWSWWWVFSPALALAALVVLGAVLVLLLWVFADWR